MTEPRRYFPQSNRFNVERPLEEDLEVGPWKCCVDEEKDGLGVIPFFHFFEMHPSERGTCIVLRISEFNQDQIKLGGCVMLDRKKAIALRNRLDDLIGVLPEEMDYHD